MTTIASITATARLIQRNLPFHQSRNVAHICHTGRTTKFQLFKEDWFHRALRASTHVAVLTLLIVWTSSILLFALLYQAVDSNFYRFQDCGLSSATLGKLTFGGFFAFSLQTCSTVGYGLPGSTQAFFEQCPLVQLVVYCQMMFSMLFHAFACAFIFARLARSESRGAQVIVSRTCCLRTTPNESHNSWVLEIQLHDLDAMHPIVEPHVRLYARTKTNELVVLRVLYPMDELGGKLFLSVPTVVRHEIDSYSALYPSLLCRNNIHNKFRLPGSGLIPREVDSRTGNMQQLICPICAESYSDLDRLKAHVKVNQLTEGTYGYPIEGSHRSLKLEDFQRHALPSWQEMKESFPEEIIVVVEGIDPLMSGTFQALQSYTLEDVSWGGRFAECVDTVKGALTVNLNNFHAVEINEKTLSNGVANE